MSILSSVRERLSEAEDPKLFATVKSSMVPCMKEGKCTKKFPKQRFLDTQTEHDGYPKFFYFTDGYISTSEAVWRMLELLQVHLENGQRVYFLPSDDHQ